MKNSGVVEGDSWLENGKQEDSMMEWGRDGKIYKAKKCKKGVGQQSTRYTDEQGGHDSIFRPSDPRGLEKSGPG